MIPIEELAQGYVLGSLSPQERDEVTRQRLYNTALDHEIERLEQVYSGLQPADAVADADPDPVATGVWERISAALEREQQALAGNVVEPCSDGGWSEHAPLIDMKPLWSDKVILIRCNPGGVEDTHDQPLDEDEHIIVIAGDLDIGGRVFGTGDYICVPAGSVHHRMSSTGGCILFTEYVPRPATAA